MNGAELHLAVGALLVGEMRAAVEKHTGFRCSAGISHNKVLIGDDVLKTVNTVYFAVVLEFNLFSDFLTTSPMSY